MKKYFLSICILLAGLCISECRKEPPPSSKRPRKELKVSGGDVMRLKGTQAGRPIATLPGVKVITYDQWLKMTDIPETGLFLVETDFIPQSLPEQLKKERNVLKEDGTLLDSTGAKIAIFMESEVFQIVGIDSSLGVIPKIFKQFAGLFVGRAEAANPYPFSAFSASMSWRYRGGFCRDYRAWTSAEAWGPIQGGARPHTRIEYMETRAELGGIRDRDSCFNCDNQNSYARWDIGCFWPAHGGTTGFHYANWKDGAITITRTWSWTP